MKLTDHSKVFYDINKTGEIIGRGYQFSEGLAPAIGNNGKYGYIDSTKQFVIPCLWKDAKQFNGDLAEVQNDDRQDWQDCYPLSMEIFGLWVYYGRFC